MRDAKESGDACCDQTSKQKNVNRDVVRQELWNKHLQNKALGLTEASRRVEEWEGSSTEQRVNLAGFLSSCVEW